MTICLSVRPSVRLHPTDSLSVRHTVSPFSVRQSVSPYSRQSVSPSVRQSVRPYARTTSVRQPSVRPPTVRLSTVVRPSTVVRLSTVFIRKKKPHKKSELGTRPLRQNRKKALYFMSGPEGLQTIQNKIYIGEKIRKFLVAWQKINWIGFSRRCKT